MSLLLDSDFCIGYFRGHRPALDWLAANNQANLAVSSVTRAELIVGAYRGNRTEQSLAAIKSFLAGIPSFPFDDRAADEYGRLRARLEIEGQMIGSNDLMIAAIAMVNHCAVVTRNVSEFRRVPTLLIERW